MKLLLDTHVFLWFIANDAQLGAESRKILQDGDNEVFLSVVSVWEIAIKYSLGKLPLPEPPGVFLPKQRQLHGVASLPLEEACLASLLVLPPLHRDPFDRMLIAQALHHKMTLMTEDRAILDYPLPIF